MEKKIKFQMIRVDLKVGIKCCDVKYLGDHNLGKYFIVTKNKI
jgi:hypothetical protein